MGKCFLLFYTSPSLLLPHTFKIPIFTIVMPPYPTNDLLSQLVPGWCSLNINLSLPFYLPDFMLMLHIDEVWSPTSFHFAYLNKCCELPTDLNLLQHLWANDRSPLEAVEERKKSGDVIIEGQPSETWKNDVYFLFQTISQLCFWNWWPQSSPNHVSGI